MCLNAIAISFGWMATTWPGESPTNADFITYWRALRGSVPPRLCCRSSRHGKIHESSVEQIEFETEISVSLCNERMDIKIGYIFVILLCQFFFFLFFWRKQLSKWEQQLYFEYHGLIKSLSRVKIIYTISYILSVYLKLYIWRIWLRRMGRKRI